MSADLTVADVLERAADLIEPEGAWYQGNYTGPNGKCFCMLGAVRRAGGFTHDVNPVTEELYWSLETSSISDWNDEPGRTQQEAVSALRMTAARAREQGK